VTLKRETTPPDRPAEWFVRCDATIPTTGWRRVLVYGGEQQCQAYIYAAGLLKDVITELQAKGWFLSEDALLAHCPDHNTEGEPDAADPQ